MPSPSKMLPLLMSRDSGQTNLITALSPPVCRSTAFATLTVGDYFRRAFKLSSTPPYQARKSKEDSLLYKVAMVHFGFTPSRPSLLPLSLLTVKYPLFM